MDEQLEQTEDSRRSGKGTDRALTAGDHKTPVVGEVTPLCCSSYPATRYTFHKYRMLALKPCALLYCNHFLSTVTLKLDYHTDSN